MLAACPYQQISMVPLPCLEFSLQICVHDWHWLSVSVAIVLLGLVSSASCAFCLVKCSVQFLLRKYHLDSLFCEFFCFQTLFTVSYRVSFIIYYNLRLTLKPSNFQIKNVLMVFSTCKLYLCSILYILLLLHFPFMCNVYLGCIVIIYCKK